VNISEPRRDDVEPQWKAITEFDPNAALVSTCTDCDQTMQFDSEVTQTLFRCACGHRYRVVRISGGDYRAEVLPYEHTDEKIVREWTNNTLCVTRGPLRTISINNSGDPPHRIEVEGKQDGVYVLVKGNAPLPDPVLEHLFERVHALTWVDIVFRPNDLPPTRSDRRGVWHLGASNIIAVQPTPALYGEIEEEKS